MTASGAAFDLPGDERGVLCIHGFTGTPFEIRHVGEALHARGVTVVGPLLPGHGETVQALAKTTWRQWYDAVSRSLDELSARCSAVAVVGQSLGGLLALRLARERPADVAAVASLSAPLFLGPVARTLIAVTRRIPALVRAFPEVPKLGGSDVRDSDMRRQNPSYPAMPVAAIHQLWDLMMEIRADLGEITTPTLVVHARHDHTAPFASAHYLAAHLGANLVKNVSLEQSYHLVAIDVERDRVATEVAEFFAPYLTGAAPNSGEIHASRARH